MRDGFIEVELKDGSRDTVPYGTCIWATGIAMHPLVAGLQSKLAQDIQNSRRWGVGRGRGVGTALLAAGAGCLPAHR